MEHSLQQYLERLSTTELEIVLQTYSQSDNKQDYEYEITEILRILQQRASSTNSDSLT